MLAAESVSLLSIACMAVTGIVLIVLPILFMIYVNVIYQVGYGQIWIGALSYIAVVMLFENALGRVMYVTLGAWATQTLYGKLVVSCILPALIEVMGLAVILGRKKPEKQTFGTFLMFGVGFSITDMLIMGVSSLLNNLSYAVISNTQGLDVMLEGQDAETVEQVTEYVGTLASAFPLSFLVPCLTGILYALFRIGVILIMYLMLKKKLPTTWTWLMAVMYFSMMLASVLGSIGFLTDGIMNALIVVLSTVFDVLFFVIIRRYCREDLEKMRFQ